MEVQFNVEKIREYIKATNNDRLNPQIKRKLMYTHNHFARDCGFSGTTLQSIMTGNYCPRMQQVIKISRAMKCSIEDLLIITP